MAAMDQSATAATRVKQASRQVDAARTTAFEMALTHTLNTTTLALIELGVFDALAGNNKLTAHEIAASAIAAKAVNIRNLERMLRVMVAYRIIIESTSEIGSRLYELSPVGEFFASNEDDDDVGSFVWTMKYSESPALHAFAATRVPLASFILEEKKSGPSEGHLMFSEFFVENPAMGKLFGMLNNAHSKDNNPRILDSYQGFEGVKVLGDMVGGYGATLKTVIARYPHVKGVNFDLPQAIA